MYKMSFPRAKTALATVITAVVLLTPSAQALSVSGSSTEPVDNLVTLDTQVAVNNQVPVNNLVAVVVATNPTIGWSEAAPSPFEPSEGERVYFNWRLDGAPGYIKLEIYNGNPNQGGSLIRTLHDWDYYPTTGYPTYKPSWDGRYNTVVVPDGTYYYKISTSATFGGAVTDVEIGTFIVGSAVVPLTPPAVISHNVQPNPFDPDTQTACFDVQMDKAANYLTIEIKDGTSTVWGPTSVSNLSGGWNYDVKCWNGRNNNGVLVNEKSYSYSLTPVNTSGNGTTVYGSVTVDYNNQPVLTPPSVTGHDVNPDPFDPQDESACFDVQLNKDGQVKLEIKDGSYTVWGPVTVSGLSDGWNYDFRCWNGYNNSNLLMAEKSYTYYLTPSNTAGNGSTVSGAVTIDFEDLPVVTPPSVTGHDVDPDPFDPDEEDACFDVQLDKSANYVTLEIKNGSTTVYGPVTKNTLVSGWNYNVLCWDGDNNSNNRVSDGTYTYYLKATNDSGTGSTVSGSVTVDADGGSTGTAPVIGTQKGDDSDDYADRDPFDPYDYSKTTIRFKLNTSATVEFTLSNGSYDIEELTYSANSGTNAIEWDGRKSNGDAYPEGTYYYTIKASNSYGNDTEHGTVKIDYDGSTGDDVPEITSHDADPEVFDPEDGEETEISFRIDDDAYVTLEILDGSTVIRTLYDEVYRSEGLSSRIWDGEDKYGDIVDDGDYEYRIKACNSDDECDTAYGDIEVDSDGSSGGSDDLITNIEVTNPVFDPSEGEETEICFTIERDNTEITVEVMEGSKVVRTLIDEAEYDEDYRRCVRWDGEDEDGDEMDDDVYQFRVRAEEGDDVQVEYRYMELDTDGIVIGFPDDEEYCGGFWDVPKDSPFCKAIELMKFRGIFTGYPDGSFRPYADINRAEATKVILLALDYDIMSRDGSNLGFWDVHTNEWYMPYLRTAQRYGIIHGYPDGSFRPGNSINRVELLKVFLEATDIEVPHCNYSPYADTPLNFETRWYMDYACFAKAYNLMDADYNGNFHPDEPMNRADVAELFYRFEKRGLFAGYNSAYWNNYWNDWDYDSYYSPYGTWYSDPVYTYSYYY